METDVNEINENTKKFVEVRMMWFVKIESNRMTNFEPRTVNIGMIEANEFEMPAKHNDDGKWKMNFDA